MGTVSCFIVLHSEVWSPISRAVSQESPIVAMPDYHSTDLVPDEFELADIDEEILDVLSSQPAATPRSVHLELETDASRSWITKRLNRLAADTKLVERLDRGLYTIDEQ